MDSHQPKISSYFQIQNIIKSVQNQDAFKQAANLCRWDLEELQNPSKYKSQQDINQSDIYKVLEDVFGIKQFKTIQQEVIQSILDGQDTMAIMPTGEGKSLIYQLLSVLIKGVTIVISPLISLIEDQFRRNFDLGIRVAFMNSTISKQDERAILVDLDSNRPVLKLLLLTPEKLVSTSFKGIIQKLFKRGQIGIFVIDEAHCIYEWGYNFRPSYLELSVLKQYFPTTQILALTATATDVMKNEICRILKTPNMMRFQSPLNRRNLRFIVKTKISLKSSVRHIVKLLATEHLKDECVLVYCLTRRECESTRNLLRENGVQALIYHADLSAATKRTNLSSWMKGEIKIVCCTIAMALGIDKKDVRAVFHVSIPKSLEEYVQGSGRGGRDGGLALCIIYYSHADILRTKRLMHENKNPDSRARQLQGLDKVIQYCEDIMNCRRKLLLAYLGEEFNSDDCFDLTDAGCDNCSSFAKVEVRNVSNEALQIVNLIKDQCGLGEVVGVQVTFLQLVDFLQKPAVSAVDKFGIHGKDLRGYLKEWDSKNIKRLVSVLLTEGYLEEKICLNPKKNHGYLYSTIASLSLQEGINWINVQYLKLSEQPNEDILALNEDQKHIGLKALISKIKELSTPWYMHCPLKTCKEIIQMMPLDLAGFGELLEDEMQTWRNNTEDIIEVCKSIRDKFRLDPFQAEMNDDDLSSELDPLQDEINEESALDPLQDEMNDESELDPFQEEMNDESELDPLQDEMNDESELDPFQEEMNDDNGGSKLDPFLEEMNDDKGGSELDPFQYDKNDDMTISVPSILEASSLDGVVLDCIKEPIESRAANANTQEIDTILHLYDEDTDFNRYSDPNITFSQQKEIDEATSICIEEMEKEDKENIQPLHDSRCIRE